MKRIWFIAWLMGGAFLSAEEAVVSRNPEPNLHAVRAPRAWLGMEVSRPDEAITAHLPALPRGIGFVIRSIHEGGPAAVAGLREYDILWKMGDQMLVNEGQLAALLRLAKPGEEISLSGFRAGRSIEVKLKLGEAPAMPLPFPSDLVDSALLPGGDSDLPMRVFNVSEKIASYSTDDGRAEIQRDGVGYKVKIAGPKDELIYEGELPANGSLDAIPEDWKRRIHALRRGLDHAMEGGMVPTRQPRPRVVPPPALKP